MPENHPPSANMLPSRDNMPHQRPVLEQMPGFNSIVRAFASLGHDLEEDVDNFKRYYTSYTFDVGYRVLIDLILHRSSITTVGNVPGAYIIENSLHYQDYEWYEGLEDEELKKESLRNKAIMEGIMDDDDESSYERQKRWNMYDDINHDHEYEMDHEVDERQEICSNETHELPVCNIIRLEMINIIHVEPSPYTPNPVRIICGPAGIVQQARMFKEKVFILDSDGALMSTQEYMQKVVDDVGEDDDFKSVAWVSATNYVTATGGTVTGCLEDIDNNLKKGKLDQVIAIVNSCSLNALDDLTMTMKDLSGTIPGSIHYKVIGEGGYGNDITVRAAMILVNVLVFTLKPSKHYINITKRNVVKVFRKDTVPKSDSG
nr:EEIG1/EHBP1 N-terminal domain-containing protein [Tanacetum cinerariifolium]